MRRIGLLAVIAVCLSILTACSDGGSSITGNTNSTNQRTGTIGDPVAKTVGTTGGTVETTSYDTKVRLIFPAGALAANTVITVTPQAPAAGDYISVTLEPGNLFFGQPVTVELEYPVGYTPGKTSTLRQLLGGENSYIATTVNGPARILTAKITSFGGSALDVLTRPAVAKIAQLRALLARLVANTPAPGAGSLSVTGSTSLAEMIASIRRQVTILENVGDFEAAFALQASIASLLNRRGDVDFPVTGTPFLEEAHATACLALSTAMADASHATITALSGFKPHREKIGNWWVIADQTDINRTGCSGATIDDFTQAALDLTVREIALQKQKLGAASLSNELKEPSAAVKAARKNKLEFEALQAAAAALSLPPLPVSPKTVSSPAVQSSVYAGLLQTELLDPLMTPAREAAWTVAQGAHTLLQYGDLLDAFGSGPLLQQDVQFVRTRIQASVYDSGGSAVASSILGIDGVSTRPVDPKRSDSLNVRPGVTLQLSGNIASLECADQGAETLTATFEGVQVATVTGSGGNLLAGRLATLAPEYLLSSAGLPADDTGTHTLQIRRSVSPCATTLGITDDLLATVTLTFSERKIVFLVSGGEIHSINPDGSGDTRLTSNPLVFFPEIWGEAPGYWAIDHYDGSPVMSPDGTKIAFGRAFYRGVSSPVVMVMNADGSGITALTAPTEWCGGPAWSPDGARLAAVCASGINVINATGGTLTPVYSYNGTSGLAWSPDGTELLFLGYADSIGSNYGLYVMNVDGTGSATQLIASSNPGSNTGGTSGIGTSSSAWSPDGSKIVFSGILNCTGNNCSVGIWVMNANGSNPQLVYAFPAGSGSGYGSLPSWSPDGGKIVFTDRRNIYLMNADGSNVTNITNYDNTKNASEPAWR